MESAADLRNGNFGKARGGEGSGGETPSEDIVRNGRYAIFIAKSKAEFKHQGCFPGANWSVCSHRISNCRLPSIRAFASTRGAYPPMPTVNARSVQSLPSMIGNSRSV